MSEIARRRVGAATHLSPSGALHDPAAADALRAALAACLGAQENHIVLDFARVPVVDSESLEVLLEGQEQAGQRGGSLGAANLNAVVQDVFLLTRIDERITVLDGRWSEGHTGSRSGVRATGKRLGELLLEKGLTDAATIEKALALQEKRGRRMAQIMVDEGWLSEKDLLVTLAEQLSLPFVWLRSGVYDPRAVAALDPEAARRLQVVPLFRLQGVVYLATNDPQSLPVIETVEDLTGCSVSPVLACASEIAEVIAQSGTDVRDLSEYMGDLEGDLEVIETRGADDDAVIDQMAAGSPIINLINGVVLRAVRDGASDIHIEPSRHRCRIRLRVDGVLHTVMTPPVEVHPALVSRLKVMANLDIAERRLPQDGRIQVVTQGRVVDLRFSSLPGIFGEKVVLRVLDKSQAVLDVERLGLSDGNLAVFKQLLRRSYGLILATGPTGSGKTTTLYAALDFVSGDDKNIVTIEDPVEYQVDGLNQNQVREPIGLGFARILKHVLRQDPDIIMVGEIREHETAQIAVQAALTGHLVLSTLHTNDSIGAITRLIDMGVEPYLLSSALIGVMAQRLVRTVCPECKTYTAAPADALAEYGVTSAGQLRLARGRGCSSCFDSGYKGRAAIHEIIDCDPELQRLIVSNPSRSDLDQYLREHELKTLADDGFARVVRGETTVEEILRAVNS